MPKTVDYYFTPSSPWAYLGHQRFVDIAKRHGAHVNVKPVDLGGKIFPVSGGLPLAKRAPQRQAYRLMELKRWRAFLGLPLNLQPKFFPVAADPAALLIVAADRKELNALALAGAVMRAVWAEERDIADPETLKAIAREQGRDAEALAAAAADPATRTAYDAYTAEALERGVFGAPTYGVGDEIFWGQDRLDFVDRALTAPLTTA